MPQFLLEVLSEEIPARMQGRAAADLEKQAAERLEADGLTWSGLKAYVTPRRLALVVDGLPAATPDVTEEKRGPRADAPDKAVDGFLRSNGLTRDALETRETEKGAFFFATVHKPGRNTVDVLAEAVPAILDGIPWPKSMRWGSHRRRWVRPIHRLVAVFNGAVVPTRYDPVAAGDHTAGHPFHAPAPFPVTDFDSYKDGLYRRYVMLDPAERRQRIETDARALAEGAGLMLHDDPGLLEENAGLVEWPVVLMGHIDDKFMQLPPEALVTSMREHQKFFACTDADGNLAPRFVVVANTQAADHGRAITEGNERVLRARLEDARFFWDNDRRTPLADRVPRLAERVFHASLGSELDKVERVRALARTVADHVPGADASAVDRAALLARADLSTGMVDEFPELQGVMGRYYAYNDGEPEAVAEAIAEYYAPLGPSDSCPRAPVSVAASLADKLDTIFWFFAIGEKPTGSKDPFALRRAALGAVRFIVENDLRLPLAAVFRHAGGMGAAALPKGGAGAVIEELLAFFADRLKVALRERGVRHDLIAAVFALSGDDDLVRLLARVKALSAFLDSDDGGNLLTAYRRAANIVRIENKKDGIDQRAATVDPEALVDAEERELFDRLCQVETECATAIGNENFGDAMAVLARLRPAVDAFFDHVTVNAEDPRRRANRLSLLARIGSAMEGIADFSRIEG